MIHLTLFTNLLLSPLSHFFIQHHCICGDGKEADLGVLEVSQCRYPLGVASGRRLLAEKEVFCLIHSKDTSFISSKLV